MLCYTAPSRRRSGESKVIILNNLLTRGRARGELSGNRLFLIDIELPNNIAPELIMSAAKRACHRSRERNLNFTALFFVWPLT